MHPTQEEMTSFSGNMTKHSSCLLENKDAYWGGKRWTLKLAQHVHFGCQVSVQIRPPTGLESQEGTGTKA